MNNKLLTFLGILILLHTNCAAQLIFQVPGLPCRDVKVQNDGKIVVVSNYNASPKNVSSIMRFEGNGALDSSFGFHWIDSLFSSSESKGVNSVGIQLDGKIMAYGFHGQGLNMDFMFVRFNPNGTLDSSFGNNGVLLFDVNSGSKDTGVAIAIQADGKIVASGMSNQNVAVCRFKIDGTLDSSFGNNGISIIVNGTTYTVRAMEIHTDGKIIIAGNTLIRLLPNGNLDNTFGSNGVRTISNIAEDVAIQKDGKIVICSSSSDFLVRRYNLDGTIDTNFNHTGQSPTVWPSNYCNSRSIIIQPDGKIVASGFYHSHLTSELYAVARFKKNGTLDSSFGNGGKITTYVSGYEEGYTSTYYPDGYLLVAGWSDNGNGMIRYDLGPILAVESLTNSSLNLELTPNPFQNEIHIKSSKIQNGNCQLTIIDIMGKVYYQSSLNIIDGNLNETISTQDLPNGNYFFQLVKNNEKIVFQLVKKGA